MDNKLQTQQINQLNVLLKRNIQVMQQQSLQIGLFNTMLNASNDEPENNSFIHQLTDLLLMRMSKQNRYSDDEMIITDEAIQPFDIAKVEHDDGDEFFCIVAIQTLSCFSAVRYIQGISIIKENTTYSKTAIDIHYFNSSYIRTITELEAIEFRQAMEMGYAT